jgi:hypothetical protein
MVEWREHMRWGSFTGWGFYFDGVFDDIVD